MVNLKSIGFFKSHFHSLKTYTGQRKYNQIGMQRERSFHVVDNQEVAKLLKSLDGKKSNGEDKIPPRFVSLAVNAFTNALTMAVNCSFRNFRFHMMQK